MNPKIENAIFSILFDQLLGSFIHPAPQTGESCLTQQRLINKNQTTEMAGLMKGLDHSQLITHIRQGGVHIYSTRLHRRTGKIFELAGLSNITGFTQITGSTSHAESFIVTIQEHLPFQ